ncbi:tetratricopeptide repeat protein [Paucibacter sp. APW11]|uniref:Tetratricopeptide repeat protein n=1 Tax=Roseateles aquae TaxID=3077235 RepID=A0ABU3P776_9BURK|nr:protein kinase [Paucibacter sp. APW11]MDT8998421.1 tetratricopeptide repeat protein [Paucibacter sp. APW11]
MITIQTQPPPVRPDPALRQVKALFNQLCDLTDPAEQQARLQQEAVPPELAERVLALLRLDTQHSTRVAPAVQQMARSAASQAERAQVLPPGSRLGAWTLQSPLGQGGMGTVYLAERGDGHYEQRAAVKLLRGFSSPEALAQLSRERQILARLKHPHIARLIDGGSTADGQPFLVMDHIAGQRIDAWLRQRYAGAVAEPDPSGAGIDACLTLFRQVCDAVAHAHQQQIIHCDIKPGNVLVDDEGRAMLLDFGIAQLPGRDDGGRQALTPRYASPEQQAGEAASAVSDIYSLGRLLEDLLDLLPAYWQLPAARRAELAAIIARACRADPAQRYTNVAALLADLQAYQQQQPVHAASGGWAYRAYKRLRRRWPWVLAGSAALGLSLAFTLRLVHERDRAEAARLQALDEAAKAQAVRQVVIGIFEDFDPFIIGRKPKSFAEFVDDARRRVDADLGTQPQVQAELKHVLGLVYQRSGRSTEAITLFEQALALRRAQPERNFAVEAELLHETTVAMVNTGMAARTLPLARQALLLREQARPINGSLLGDSLAALGLVLTKLSHFDEARPLYERALQVREAADGAGSAKVASALHSLGALAEREQRYAEGQQYLERSLALKAKLLPPEHPYTLNSRHMLALCLLGQGQVEPAVRLLREVLRQRSSVHGEASVFAAETRSALARALQAVPAAGSATARAEAEALLRQNLAQFATDPGRRSSLYAADLAELARLLARTTGKGAEALAAAREALEILQSQPAQDRVAIAQLQLDLAEQLIKDGALSAAAEPLQAAQATLALRHWAASHSLALRPTLLQARWQLASGQAPAALATLQPVLPLPALAADAEQALQALLADLRRSGLQVPARGTPGKV